MMKRRNPSSGLWAPPKPFTRPFSLVRGKGAFLFDAKGKAYYDGTSTIWTNLVGHGREEIIEAMAAQSRKLSFLPLIGDLRHPAADRLAKSVLQQSPFGHTHLLAGSSGTDMTEAALKLARHYWHAKAKRNKKVILSLRFSYHGSSLAATALSDVPETAEPYTPLAGGTHAIPNLGLRELESTLKKINAKENVAALLLEPLSPSEPTLEHGDGLKRLLERYQVLLLVDEVKSGMGRTGKPYASTAIGLDPDIVYLAKSLTSGYAPLAVLTTREEIYCTVASDGGLRHGSTFAGHPAAAIAALKVQEIVKREKLIARAERLGTLLGERLSSLKEKRDCVDYVFGRGLLRGLVLTSSPDNFATGNRISDRLRKMGFLVRVQGRVMGIAPPPISTERQIEDLVSALDEALRKEK